MKKTGKITIGSFDLAKGIGMFIIVAGHTLSFYEDPLFAVLLVISIFGQGIMPMFYIVSGIGSKKTESRKCLKKSAGNLLLPWIWVIAFVAILFPIFHYMFFHWWPGAVSEMLKTVLGILSGCRNSGEQIWGIELYESSAAWFLFSLFVALNLMNAIWKVPDEKRRLFFVGLCVLTGLWCKVVNIWYFCIPDGLMAVGYVYLGSCIKKQKWVEKRCPIWQWAILVGIFLLNEMVKRSGVVWKTVRELLLFLGTGCWGLIFIRFTLWANRFSGSILEGIRKIGRYSYYIMCIHSVEMSCIPWYLFAQKFSTHPYLGFFLQMVLRGIIIGLGCMCLTRIMKYRHQKRMKKSNVSY